MSAPTSITIELELDKFLASFRGYDSDGEPRTEPMTLEEAVIESVVDRLVHRMLNDRDGLTTVRNRIDEIRREVIREKVEPIVESALTDPVQRTNDWGSPVGPVTTLRDEITKQVSSWLTTSTDRYDRNGSSNMASVIKAQVIDVLGKELKAEIDAAKAQVRAAVRDQAAQVLAGTIAAMAETGVAS